MEVSTPASVDEHGRVAEVKKDNIVQRVEGRIAREIVSLIEALGVIERDAAEQRRGMLAPPTVQEVFTLDSPAVSGRRFSHRLHGARGDWVTLAGTSSRSPPGLSGPAT